MKRSPSGPAPAFFEDAASFRAWLKRHGASKAELVVGFRKIGSGKPSITWPESVDEALCFGWIDGVRKRSDDESYQIRFTPRRPGSIWSTVNIAKVEALTVQGRMQPAGLAAYAKRTERKSGVYAYEQEGALELTATERREFRKNTAAWRYFESMAPSYRKTVLHWLVSAKQTATRARRFEQLLAACADGRRLK